MRRWRLWVCLTTDSQSRVSRHIHRQSLQPLVENLDTFVIWIVKQPFILKVKKNWESQRSSGLSGVTQVACGGSQGKKKRVRPGPQASFLSLFWSSIHYFMQHCCMPISRTSNQHDAFERLLCAKACGPHSWVVFFFAQSRTEKEKWAPFG